MDGESRIADRGEVDTACVSQRESRGTITVSVHASFVALRAFPKEREGRASAPTNR